jgi:hypothetical protein
VPGVRAIDALGGTGDGLLLLVKALLILHMLYDGIRGRLLARQYLRAAPSCTPPPLPAVDRSGTAAPDPPAAALRLSRRSTVTEAALAGLVICLTTVLVDTTGRTSVDNSISDGSRPRRNAVITHGGTLTTLSWLYGGDHGLQAVVLLGACRAPAQVRCHPGDDGVRLGAEHLGIDVDVELGEADLAAHLGLAGSQKPAQRVRDRRLAHRCSFR